VVERFCAVISSHGMAVVLVAVCSLLSPELIEPSLASATRRSVLTLTGATLVALTGGSNLAAALAVTDSTPTVPSWRLQGGVDFPILALNTAGLSSDGAERAFRAAVLAGITHVDFHPGAERNGVARALRSGATPLDRESVFLTTKINMAPPGATAEEAAAAVNRQLNEDLRVLGCDAVDMLMLRDSASCGVMQAQWAELEKAKKAGKARSIGVVNFCEGSLRCLLESAHEMPAVNYYMLHVGMGRDPQGLTSFGERHGVRTFAYGAVGEPGAPDCTSHHTTAPPSRRPIHSLPWLHVPPATLATAVPSQGLRRNYSRAQCFAALGNRTGGKVRRRSHYAGSFRAGSPRACVLPRALASAAARAMPSVAPVRTALPDGRLQRMAAGPSRAMRLSCLMRSARLVATPHFSHPRAAPTLSLPRMAAERTPVGHQWHARLGEASKCQAPTNTRGLGCYVYFSEGC
jgi:diketogulonate reductase-like aldo/keto reductase